MPTRLWRFRRHDCTVKPPLGSGVATRVGTARRGDEQFELSSSRRRLPHGWALVAIEVEESEKLLRPILYASGERDARPVTFELPVTRRGRIERLIHLPDRVTELRLALDGGEARFPRGSVRIYEIGTAQVLWRAMRAFLRSELAHPTIWRRAWDYLRHKGLRTTIARLVRPLTTFEGADYASWVALYDTPSADDFTAMREQLAALRRKPLISVIVAVSSPRAASLRAAIDSVSAQIYPHWQLFIAGDTSSDPEIASIVQDYARGDPRITAVSPGDAGVFGAYDAALGLAQGEFTALMDQDDRWSAHALYMAAVELEAHPDADLVYSDEDKIDSDGQRFDPYFKPDWNQELLYSQDLVHHSGIYRTALLREAGGFRESLGANQDWALRVAARTVPARIRHLPHILCHRQVSERAQTSASGPPNARRALDEHFARRGEAVRITAGKLPNSYRVAHPLSDPRPRVSLIVPTRDRLALLRACVDGLLHKTRYPDLEIIIVDNDSRERATLAYFQSLAAETRVHILPVPGAFNFSALNNRAVEVASGAIVGLINNDIEVIRPGWLEEMVSHAVRPDVGAVGAKLYYRDNTIQHAGVVIGVRGIGGHVYKDFPRSAPGHHGELQSVREVSCVTAACMIMAKTVFESVGGFDEVNLKVAYNDVDLCLKLREAGYRIIWTPYAELYHMEAASRGSDFSRKNTERFTGEGAYMRQRWGARLQEDPLYSPNLSLTDLRHGLAFPPRVTRPWARSPLSNGAGDGSGHGARPAAE